jgi:hypothetical protein
MNEWKRCDECRALIDAPSTVDPHPRLHRYGTSRTFADFISDNYQCEKCATKFRRHETIIPDCAVTWTVIE